MTACRSSLLSGHAHLVFLDLRLDPDAGPLMNFTISLAFSVGIPFRIVTTWRTVPLAASSTLP